MTLVKSPTEGVFVDQNEALQTHGALQEGAHIAGYTFSRLLNHLEWILEDDRWKACGYEDVNSFLATLDWSNFKLLAEQRKKIVKKIADAEASQRQIARMLGVNVATVSRDLGVAFATPSVASQVQTDVPPVANATPTPTSGFEAGAVVVQKDRNNTKQQEREERAAEKDAELLALTPSSNVDLHHLAIAELHTVVEAGSVDVIFTDPPYPHEYLPVWGELATFAAHALKPSGVLVAMSGQSYLPEVMASLGEHLTYRWTMAYLMPGADTTIWPRKIKTHWKPVLVYGAAEEWLAMDVVHADTLKAQDDRFHQWGQQAPGMVRLLEPFVKPGYVVCDPFVGGGTAALAAQVHGCAFIGADSDAKQLDTTRKRLNVV